MLTPDDIQKKMFSLGRKLENNDVGVFVKEVQINYQLVYDQVIEQEKQIKGMEKKLKYYRDVEGSLQDALVHAEKVSNQKIKESEREAEKIEQAAHKKAEDIIADAKSELVYLKSIIKEFEQVYDNYQDKYKNFIQGQLKFINDSKQFMEKEKLHVKKFVSNIDVEDYSAGALNNEKREEQYNQSIHRNEGTFNQRKESTQVKAEVEEEEEIEKFTDNNDEPVGFPQEEVFDDNIEQDNEIDNINEDNTDFSDNSVEEQEDETETYTFGKVIEEQEMPMDNQTEASMETPDLEENMNSDELEEELSNGSSNIDDMFTLPEIDMDSLDFSSLNFSSNPQSGGVDFNSTLNAIPQVNDQSDMPMQDEGYSYGQEFNTDSDYNYGSQSEYGVDSAGNVGNINESTDKDVEKEKEDRVPDLSQNANVELKFANDSFFGKKKKPDGKEKVLQGLNLGGSKADEKARIRQLENSYAQDLLNANKQVANRGAIEPESPEGSQGQSSRNYGPANYNPENKGLASKPLNAGGQEQQRRSLFSMPGEK